MDALTLTLTTLHAGFVALPAPFYGFPPRSKITIPLAPLWLVHSFVGLPNQSPFSPFILATCQAPRLSVVAENQSRPPLFSRVVHMVTGCLHLQTLARINGHTLAPPTEALQRDGGVPIPDARCCDSVGGARTAMYPNNGLPVGAYGWLLPSYVAAAGAM